MKNSLGYITLSFAGLILLTILYICTPITSHPYKLLFLLLFMFICLGGMLASAYPNLCLKFFKIETVTVYECKNMKIKNMGHHPDCGQFSRHVFSFKNKKYCVGCAGLLTGALLAILTCILYVFFGVDRLIFWIGIIVVLSSLLELIFLKLEDRYIKFASNLGLVWGSSLILVGLVEYSNISLNIYFLFLIILWIMTRTEISRENHDLICTSCPLIST